MSPPDAALILAQSIAALRLGDTPDTDQQPPHAPVIRPTEPSLEQQLDAVFIDLLETELSNAGKAHNEADRVDSLGAALLLLAGVNPNHRQAGFERLARLLAQTSGAGPVLDFIRHLIGAYGHYRNAYASDGANEDAERFARLLMQAIPHYPFTTQCQILCDLTHAAASARIYAMAKAAIDETLACTRSPDPAITVQRVGTFATHFERLPEPYRTLAAVKLHPCAPLAMPWRLQALEAIAAHMDLLPESRTTQEFAITLNQEIYHLRLDAC